MVKGDVSNFTAQGEAMSFADFVTNIVPDSAIKAFANGDILQVVFFSVLFGAAAMLPGSRGRPIVDLAESGRQR